jgi:hypothetical protein
MQKEEFVRILVILDQVSTIEPQPCMHHFMSQDGSSQQPENSLVFLKEQASGKHLSMEETILT